MDKIYKIREVYDYKIKTYGLYCPIFTGQFYTVRAMYNFAYIARHTIGQYHNVRAM